MRAEFPGHQQLSEHDRESLWRSSRIVLDANALLDVYRLEERVRDEMLELLTTLQPRLWLPYQFANEFHLRRVDVIRDALRAHKNTQDEIDRIIERCNAFRAPPHVPQSAISELRHFREALVLGYERLQKCFDDDPAFDRICHIFEGRVGPPLPHGRLDALRTEWPARIRANTPPGMRDKKDTVDLPGDLVGWMEIITEVKNSPSTAGAVLLVTSDVKDDWWIRVDGLTLGPRAELRTEFHKAGGSRFWMYTLERFLEQAQARLGLAVSTALETSIKTPNAPDATGEHVQSRPKSLEIEEDRKGRPVDEEQRSM